jgi:hypothetical protein
MTIPSSRKVFIPSLLMASAAFFGSTAGAAASDLASGDPQEQARQLLAPTNAGRPVAPSGSSVPGGALQSVIDPQELARRLLAGAPSSENTAIAPPAIGTGAGGRNALPGDSQALAQRMILGARSAAKARTAITAVAHSRGVRGL